MSSSTTSTGPVPPPRPGTRPTAAEPAPDTARPQTAQPEPAQPEPAQPEPAQPGTGVPPGAGDRPAPPATGRRRRALVRLSTLLGAGLALGGGVFVATRIASGWSEYGEVITDAQWGWSVAGLALAVLGMSTMGLVWRRIIAALGGQASRHQVFVWYMFGNLGKYVPGGLWALVGRSELAVRGGLARPIAYNSVALSMGATYLCATVVCAVLLPFVLLREGSVGLSQLWVFGLIPVGLATLHPALLGRVFRLSEKLLGKGAPVAVPRWLTSVGLVARHALPWLALGFATWLVALTFDPDAPLLLILFAGIFSWIIGFVVFFVPGGIGVREAVFTAIVSTAMPPHLAATIAVVSRLVFVAADALGATAAVPLSRRGRRPGREAGRETGREAGRETGREAGGRAVPVTRPDAGSSR